MPITFEEKYKGRTGSRDKRSVDYIARGSDDDAAILAEAENVLPSTHDGLVFTSVTSIKPIADEIWVVTASYGALTQSVATVPTPALGSATYTFNSSVKDQTFLHSKDQIARFPADAPNVGAGGLIGLSVITGRQNGLTVPAGPVTDELVFEYPAAVIPANYRATVRSLMGKVCLNSWLGEPAGSMRFVSCRSSVTGEGRQSISYGFAHREAEAVTIGGQNLGTVDGWDFPWSFDVIKTFTSGTKKVLVPVPLYVYVERLLGDRVSFSGLGLPV